MSAGDGPTSRWPGWKLFRRPRAGSEEPIEVRPHDDAAQSGGDQPDAEPPGGDQPGVVQSDGEKLGAAQPGAAQSGGKRPGAAQSGGELTALGAALAAAEAARDEAVRARDEAVLARDAATRAEGEAEDAQDEAQAAQRAIEASGSDADPILDEEVRRAEAGVDDDNPFGRPGRPWSRRSPFRVGFGGAIGVGLAYLLYRALINAQSVIILVVVAAFLAIGLNPTVSRLERFGMRRGAAVGIVFLAVAIFFSVVGYAILPPLVEQGSRFIRSIPQYVEDLKNNRTIADLNERFGVVDRAQDYVSKRFGDEAASNILSFGSTIASTVFKGLTILILTLYFLSYFKVITETAYRLVPRSRRARASLLGDEILGRVGGYVAGAFVVALIAGSTTLIALAVLQVPYPLALALVVMITDIIPLIGATIGAVAVTLVTLIGSTPKGLAIGVFFLLYQQVENYVVYPRVMKRSVDINPAAAIVGALVGGTLLGVVGALIAVPATAALQLIVREVVLPRQDSA